LVYFSNLVCDARWFSSQLFFWVFFRAVDCEIFILAVLPKPHYLTVELPTVPYLLSTKHLWAKLPGNPSITIYQCNTGLRSSGNLGDPSLSHIFKMWGHYWLNLSDLSNRKETPPFSPAGPHIRRGLQESTSFQKSSFGMLLSLLFFYSGRDASHSEILFCKTKS
jgi:hypothetical protein